jgi:hypothetical protein
MTIVAIWLETADQGLWSVADTRISNRGREGIVVLTDSGAKLLVLPVLCQRLPHKPEEIGTVVPHFSTTFGFAFAGGSLPALLTYATATTLLQNLASVKEDLPPKLSEVAVLVQRLAQRFSDEIRAAQNSQTAQFECAVFGWCPLEKRFQIFHIAAASGTKLSTRQTDPKNENEVVLLGNGQEAFWRRLEQFQRDGEPHGRKGRWPKLVVESMAVEGEGQIGGSLSIGIADPRGYKLYSWVRPVEHGKSSALLSLNGLNVQTDIGSIGRYFIGMHMMV